MDLSYTRELAAQIRQGVQQSFPADVIEWEGLVGQKCLFHVGKDVVWVSLQDVMSRIDNPDKFEKDQVPTGRHRICVDPQHYPRQTFYENRQGRFPLDRIITAVVRCIALEQAYREVQEDKDRLLAYAEVEAERLRAHFGVPESEERPNPIAITSSFSHEGRLVLNLNGITPHQATRLIELAHELGFSPTRPREDSRTRTMWDRLQEATASPADD